MPKKRAKRGGNGYFSTSEIKLTETKKSSIDILFCEIETSIVLGYPKPIFESYPIFFLSTSLNYDILDILPTIKALFPSLAQWRSQ